MKTRVTVTACLTLAVISLSGCAALLIGGGAAAGAGAVMFARGALITTEEAQLHSVYAASQSAMTDMGYRITERRQDRTSARVKAMDSDDTDITINMKRKSTNVTEVSIRYGTFGDETKSQLILDSIRARM